jgi:hypothetical protein
MNASSASGKWVELGRLKVTQYVCQSGQLVCGCTVIYRGRSTTAPTLGADIRFLSVSSYCTLHDHGDIGQLRVFGSGEKLWVAPDAPLVD